MLEIAAYVEHNRPKLEQEAVESITLSPNDRYYVQQSNMGVYLVKERLESGQDKPDDSVVNEYYDSLYQASLFARQLNEYQLQLDTRYGRWMRHTITPETLAYKYRFSTIEIPPLPDVAPFRFRWHFPGLGSYRSCRQVYCSVSYEDLPPLPEELFQGTMDWLPPVENASHMQGIDCYFSEVDLHQIISLAHLLHIVLPDSFLKCLHVPELLERIPSCTDCYFDLSVAAAVQLRNERGYLIRFLLDRQGAIAWYLYLTPEGKQYVLVGTPWLDSLDDTEQLGSTQKEKIGEEIERTLEVCAVSFEAFLYRFWLENMLWYKLSANQETGPLTEEEERYLYYYTQSHKSEFEAGL